MSLAFLLALTLCIWEVQVPEDRPFLSRTGLEVLEIGASGCRRLEHEGKTRNAYRVTRVKIQCNMNWNLLEYFGFRKE